MNNKEIKEILDKCTPFLFGDEADKLTNYITNLQEKNKKLKMDLIDQGFTLLNSRIELSFWQNNINKAIEYIEKNKQIAMFADLRKEGTHQYDLECDADDLLDILKGEEQ